MAVIGVTRTLVRELDIQHKFTQQKRLKNFLNLYKLSKSFQE